MLVAKDPVEKVLTAMLLITEPNVPVHLISWEIHTPDVTPSVLVTVTALPTKLVSSSNAATPATTLTLMCAVRGLPVKLQTTRLYAPAPRATPETHSSAVGSLRRETCVILALADLEPIVRQVLTGLVLTGLCAPVQLDIEEIL